MSSPTATDQVDLPPVPGIRHRFLTVRGALIHLAEAGANDAPTVLLLHGFPQHWYAWRDIIPALAMDHHVIAVDLPGFGWSEPGRHGYSTAERTRCVLALLDELGLKRVDIAAHDWGAWLAFRVALDAPQRIRRLVCIAEMHPWPLQRRLLPNLWRMWVTALFEIPGLGARVQSSRRLLKWFLSRDACTPGVWTEDLVTIYAKRAARPASARAGQHLHGAFIVRDMARLALGRDRRRRFETQTVLIAGSRDAYLPPAVLEVPRRRQAMIRIETVPGGHFLLDENPAGVVAAIGSHLDPEGAACLGTSSVDKCP